MKTTSRYLVQKNPQVYHQFLQIIFQAQVNQTKININIRKTLLRKYDLNIRI